MHRRLITALPALLLLAAGPARAAETAAPPSHLKAYNLDWINYIDPADLPPVRQAVCLVDTGVAITPDTPADNPDGPIVARLAGDGGSGEPFNTTDDNQLHGTRMAMAAVAPQNDWGTIGAWSAGRIISVRATRDGESTFRPDAYGGGINLCIKRSLETPIAAINLSLSCANPCDLNTQTEAALQDRVGRAHDYGIAVVAAAGNQAGAAAFPAAEPGVFAVGAAGVDGRLCADAAYDDHVAVLGPACPVSSADPVSGEPFENQGAGSSTASMIAATLVSLLRTLRPDATYEQAEAWVADTARDVDGRPVINGAAAATAAGLGSIVDRARLRQAAAETVPSATPEPAVSAVPTPTMDPSPCGVGQRAMVLSLRVGCAPTTRKTPFPLPRVLSAGVARKHLALVLGRLPSHAAVRVRAVAGSGEFKHTRNWTRHTRRFTLKVSTAPRALQIQLVPVSDFGDYRPSPILTLNRHGSHYTDCSRRPGSSPSSC